jgi:hypothetical protein
MELHFLLKQECTTNLQKLVKNTCVVLPEIFSAALSLLNLLEESLGRSKPRN